MRTTLRPTLRRALIFSAELVLGPMVPMMEVRRYSLAGVYSVLSWLSHSIRVRPALRWSRLGESSAAPAGARDGRRGPRADGGNRECSG